MEDFENYPPFKYMLVWIVSISNTNNMAISRIFCYVFAVDLMELNRRPFVPICVIPCLFFLSLFSALSFSLSVSITPSAFVPKLHALLSPLGEGERFTSIPAAFSTHLQNSFPTCLVCCIISDWRMQISFKIAFSSRCCFVTVR